MCEHHRPKSKACGFRSSSWRIRCYVLNADGGMIGKIQEVHFVSSVDRFTQPLQMIHLRHTKPYPMPASKGSLCSVQRKALSLFRGHSFALGDHSPRLIQPTLNDSQAQLPFVILRLDNDIILLDTE